MHQRDIAALAQVRMRILLIGNTMSGPTRMRYSYHSAGIFLLRKRLQLSYLALGFIYMQFILAIDKRHSGTIIASVLQPMETFNKDWISLTLTNVTYNSAHRDIRVKK